MDDFINNYVADIEGFLDTLSKENESLKERFSTISLLWVKKMNYFKDIDYIDFRNEESIAKCYSIKVLLREKLSEFYPSYDGHLDVNLFELKKDIAYELQFVEKLSDTHKTLQQSFTGIVLNWLMLMGSVVSNELFKEISNQINDTFDEYFPLLSFI